MLVPKLKSNWLYVIGVALALCCGPAAVTLYSQNCPGPGCDCMKTCGDAATQGTGTRSGNCWMGGSQTPCYWRDCSATKLCYRNQGFFCISYALCTPQNPPAGNCTDHFQDSCAQAGAICGCDNSVCPIQCY